MRSSTSSILIFTFAVASATAYSACTAYDPVLGARPFTCKSSEPKCPDGYSCIADTMGVEACTIAGPGATIDAPGSGSGPGFQCQDDSVLEGPSRNETVGTASSTPVASTRTMISLAGLAICPDGDKDTYRIDISLANQHLKADLTYDPVGAGGGAGGVALSMSVLNAGGTPIANGSPLGGNKVSVTTPALAPGSSPYYVQVFGPATGQNNYKLVLTVQ